MFNLDKLNQKKVEIQTALCAAIKEQDEEKTKEALNRFGEFIGEMVTAEATAGTSAYVDSGILSARGIRQLTQKETEYYDKLIQAAKSPDPKNALSNLDVTIPETIIESVFDDIKRTHPLLNLIDFKNSTGLTKMIYDKSGNTEAVWGDIDATTGAEITGALGVADTAMYKLMGLLVMPNGILDLGASWLDRYVRELLVEYIANGLETGYVYGTGNKQPIGMARSVADDVTVTGGVYPLKTAKAIDKITPLTFGALLAELAKAPAYTDENPVARPVDNVILVVNPFDYFKVVMPATTYQLPDGTFKNNIMPYPCTIVQSAAVPAKEAILGLAKRYFAACGFGKDGKIEADDSAKFMEDCRAYRAKLYATGLPKDDNAFIRLDITNLKPEDKVVIIGNGTDSPVNTKEVTAG